MSEPTPGPWADAGGIGHGSWIVGPNGENVAVVYSRASVHGAQNARLIAAGPTLYDFAAKRAAEGDVEARAIVEAIHAPR